MESRVLDNPCCRSPAVSMGKCQALHPQCFKGFTRNVAGTRPKAGIRTTHLISPTLWQPISPALHRAPALYTPPEYIGTDSKGDSPGPRVAESCSRACSHICRSGRGVEGSSCGPKSSQISVHTVHDPTPPLVSVFVYFHYIKCSIHSSGYAWLKSNFKKSRCWRRNMTLGTRDCNVGMHTRYNAYRSHGSSSC